MRAGTDPDDPFSACSYVSYFIALEVPSVNGTQKIFAVASRTSADADTNSSIVLLDEHFQELYEPVGGNFPPYPGVLTLLESATLRTAPNTTMIVYGGHITRSPPYTDKAFCEPDGCGLLQVCVCAALSFAPEGLTPFAVPRFMSRPPLKRSPWVCDWCLRDAPVT